VSVPFFSAKELGNIVAADMAVYRTDSDLASQRQRFAYLCAGLAAYSVTNRQAFVHTYEDRYPEDLAEGTSADDIAREALAIMHPDFARAASSLGGLAFNSIANDGTDFATVESMRVIESLQQRFVEADSARR
jgi:hypothetical protein